MSIAPTSTVTPAPAAQSDVPRHGLFGPDGFSFHDFLDIINPLQHIPVVSTLYRALTGDTMSAGAEIAGGALYGGPIGAFASVADVAFADATGKDFGDTVLSWVGFGGSDDTALAQTAAPATPEAAAPALPLAPAQASMLTPTLASFAPVPVTIAELAPAVPGMPALVEALQRNGADADTSARAALVYRAMLALPQAGSAPELLPLP